MKYGIRFFLASIIGVMLLMIQSVVAQTINPERLQKPWNAKWKNGSGTANGLEEATDVLSKEYGVFKFRKIITLSEKPSTFVIHVSADNRYKLFVNGTHVSQGPARGDLYFWNFESVDIASHLNEGRYMARLPAIPLCCMLRCKTKIRN